MIDIKNIRDKYPNVTRLQDGITDPEAYCVGGAIVKEAELGTGLDVGWRFPTTYKLAKALRKMNPHLPKKFANTYAAGIIKYNDLGAFEIAWTLAEMALTGKWDVNKWDFQENQ